MTSAEILAAIAIVLGVFGLLKGLNEPQEPPKSSRSKHKRKSRYDDDDDYDYYYERRGKSRKHKVRSR